MSKKMSGIILVLIAFPFLWLLLFDFKPLYPEKIVTETIALTTVSMALFFIRKFALTELLLPWALFVTGLQIDLLEDLFLLEPTVANFFTLLEDLAFAASVILIIYIMYKKAMQRRTIQAELHLQSLALKSSLDGIAIMNEHGEYIYVNQALAEIYEYDDPIQLLGRNWSDFWVKEANQDLIFEDIIPDVIRVGRQQIQAVAPRKDGSRFYKEVSLAAINKGQVVAVVRDISERRKAEKQIREQYEDLQSSYEEITALNTQLQEYQDKLLGSNSRLRQQYEDLQSSYEEITALNTQLQEYQDKLKESNHRLSNSEERLELALWASEEALWDLDIPTGKVIFSNKFSEILEHKPGEIGGHINSWLERIHPDDAHEVLEKWKAYLKGLTPCFEVEHRLRKKSGEWVWILGKGKVASCDPDGKIIRAIGTFQEVSQKKAMEAALRQSENLYRSLVEAVPEIITHMDINGNYTWVNKQGKEFFGDDYYGHHYSEYFAFASDARAANKTVESLLQGNQQLLLLETLHIRKDGQERLLRWQSKILKDENQVSGILSTARDITDYKKAEDKLRESQERYRRLFEDSPVGLLKCDAQGNIIQLNKRCRVLLGLSLKVSPEKLNLVTPDSPLQILPQDYLREMLNLGKDFHREVKLSSSGDEETWFNVNADPVLDYKGHLIEVLVSLEDISKQKKAQEKIQYLSFHDSLTGLYNRAFFDHEFQRLDQSRQLPLSIIIGDLNGLKLLNDAFGHFEGDKMLKRIAGILKSVCREEDIIARFGGDEFVILLPQTNHKTASEICARIKMACQAADESPIPPSIALGTATKTAKETDIFEVLREAEDLMYGNKLLESKSTRNAIISSLEIILHDKTWETREHIERLQEMARKFAPALWLSENDLERLLLLARLHDIGKVVLAEELLNKQGPFTLQEQESYRKHPETGYHIVQSFNELSIVAEEILTHHEKWDGSGYPQGLTGEDIPYLSRILSIIHAYDLLTHYNTAGETLSHTQALDKMREFSGFSFDPALLDLFIQTFK